MATLNYPASLLLFLLLLLLLTRCCLGFNLGTDDPIGLVAPVNGAPQRDTYFGYSVAMVRVGDKVWSLVGAPRSNDSSLLPGVLEPGALYACLLTPGQQQPNCYKIAVDAEGNGPSPSGGYNNRRDWEWLGSTTAVQTHGEDPLIVTCAPRWTNVDAYPNYETVYYMNGACHYARASQVLTGNQVQFSSGMKKTVPLLDRELQVQQLPGDRYNSYYYQYGQAGMALTLTKGGDVIIGAPGIANWAGSIIRSREGSLNSQGYRPLYHTVYRPPDYQEQSQYLGYSVTSGVFFGTTELVAAAAPRSGYRGKVLVMLLPSRGDQASVRQTLTGPPQHYTGFGWCLAAADVDGDGWEDLFVGAPLFADGYPSSEDGRVYVYSSRAENGLRLKMVTELRSRSSGGRFGAAITAMGDLNRDGYNDIAVGAPQDGGGAGAIFIFLGSQNGVASNPDQEIRASSVSQFMSGFGGSLTSGVDVDGNGYPDVTVGSSGSNEAVVLLAREVLHVDVNITTLDTFLTKEEQSFNITACARYRGYGLTEDTSATLSLALDPQRPPSRQPRAYFPSSGEATTASGIRLAVDRHTCLTVEARLRAGVSEVETPLEVEARLEDIHLLDPDGQGDACGRCPVLSPASSTVATHSIPIALGCGDDLKCHPVLEVVGQFVGADYPLTVGSGKDAFLEIVLDISKEFAYQTKLTVLLPKEVSVRSLPVWCSLVISSHDDDNNDDDSDRNNDDDDEDLLLERVSCQLPSPLRPGEKMTVTVAMQVSATVPTKVEELVFNIMATALNAEAQTQAVLKLQHHVDIRLGGIAEPERLYYGSEDKDQELKQKYHWQVQNIGVTQARSALLKIRLPYKLQQQTFLFTDVKVKQQNTPEKSDCRIGNFNSTYSADRPNLTSQDVGSLQNTDQEDSVAAILDVDGKMVLQCSEESDAGCLEVACSLSDLGTSVVTLVTTLNVSAIRGLYGPAAVARVTVRGEALWQDGDSKEQLIRAAVSSLIAPVGWSEKGDPVAAPWWLYLVSILAGMALLAATVLILYKCGFFNRKRPPSKASNADQGEQPGTEETSTHTQELDELEGVGIDHNREELSTSDFLMSPET